MHSGIICHNLSFVVQILCAPLFDGYITASCYAEHWDTKYLAVSLEQGGS